MESKKIEERMNAMPDSCVYEDWEFTYKSRYKSNFFPYLEKVTRVINVRTKKEQWIMELVCWFSLGQWSETEILLEDLKKLDFQINVDIRCYVADEQTRKYLIKQILYQLSHFVSQDEQKVYLLDRLGYAQLSNGKEVYNAGSRIIGEAGVKVLSDASLEKYNLAVDSDLDGVVLERKIKEMLHLQLGISEILFSYLVLGLLREPFQKSGVPIRFCLYILGENQSFKTTLATYYCSVYNRDEDVERWLHNFTGSEAKLMESLDREKDCVSIIDDLNRSDSKSQERQQEAKMSTLVRVAANNVGKETMNNQYEVNAQVAFCGEYPLKNISTNNRLVVLLLEKGMIDQKKLLEIQRNPLVLSTFAERFIKWVLANYQNVCQNIRQYYQDFLNNRAESDGYQERLSRSAGVLNTAYRIFLCFCEENHWNSELDISEFNIRLLNTLDKQIECLNLGEKEEVDYIIELYRSFRDEEDYGHITTKRPKEFWQKDIYYDKKQNLVYILGSKLEEMIQYAIPMSVKVYDVANKFEENGILCVDNNKNHTRTKKLGGRRCFVFDHIKWREYIEEVITAQEESTFND